MIMEIIISVFLLFVGIAILVIIHICIVGRAYRREFFGSDGLPIIKGAGMTKQDLKQLPCFQYKPAADDNSNKQFDCAVCLDTFKVGDACRMLPNCHHYFHVQCVDEWLVKSPFCPICRTCTTYIATLSPPKLGGLSGFGQPDSHSEPPSAATYAAADNLC